MAASDPLPHTTLHTTLHTSYRSSINLQSKESVSAGSRVSQRERACAGRRRGFPAREKACLASCVTSARTSSRRGLTVAFASSFQIAHHDGSMDGPREAFGASGVLPA